MRQSSNGAHIIFHRLNIPIALADLDHQIFAVVNGPIGSFVCETKRSKNTCCEERPHKSEEKHNDRTSRLCPRQSLKFVGSDRHEAVRTNVKLHGIGLDVNIPI